MQEGIGILISLVMLAGCAAPGDSGAAQKQTLQVRWQRLVDAKGQTCERCGSTERATEDGVKKLRRCLEPVGVEVVLEKAALSPSAFAKDPLESNRIWLAGKPIEEWLQPKVGKSQCCGTCGDSECRTLTVEGQTYETIPAELIVRAGLLAGAQLVGIRPANPLNPVEGWSQRPACCPPSAGGQKR